MSGVSVELIPYAKDLSKLSDNAVNFFVLGPVIPTGMILWLQHTSEEDRDNDFDAVRIGRGTDEFDVHWWESHEDCLTGVIYWMDKPLLFVPEGKRVIFRFDGTTVGDHLFCTIDGYLLPKMLSSDVVKFDRLRRAGEEGREKHQKRVEEILEGCEEYLKQLWKRYDKLTWKRARG